MHVDSRRWRLRQPQSWQQAAALAAGAGVAQPQWPGGNQVAWYQATPALSVARLAWPRWIRQFR